MKSSCHNSRTLIATHFRAGYATTVVNNLTSAHSIKANCEQDFSTPLLKDAHELFLSCKRINNDSNEIDCNRNYASENDSSVEVIIFDPQFSETELSTVNNEAIQKDSSLVCNEVVKKTKCRHCIKTLETTSNTDTEAINSDTEHKLIKYPSDVFIHNFKIIICGIKEVLPHICADKCVKKKLLDHIGNIETKKMGCSKHYEEVGMIFKEHCATYGILTFCKNVNDLLSGKNETLPPDFNFIEERAYIFHQKNKRIGKHSDIFNSD